MRLLEGLLLPPLSCLLLLLGGLVLRRSWRKTGNVLMAVAIAGLWLGATPWVGAASLRTLQTTAALDASRSPPTGPQAIVVLSAEMDRDAVEYGGQSVGPMTLQRIRYAAHLQRRTGLPLLVSGGHLPGHLEAHAKSMRSVLVNELGVPVEWVEDQSRTTAENAARSATILRAAGIETVFLVTHAWHLPRAVASFTRRGLAVVGAPTAFRHLPDPGLAAFLPHWSGLRDCSLAMHEWLGRAWYALTD